MYHLSHETHLKNAMPDATGRLNNLLSVLHSLSGISGSQSEARARDQQQPHCRRLSSIASHCVSEGRARVLS